MENSQCAGLTTQRLDYLKNYEIKKKTYYNGSNYTYSSNRLQDILHHCPSSCEEHDHNTNGNGSEANPQYTQEDSSKGLQPSAGVRSDVINEMNVSYRRSKCSANVSNEIKNIIQNTYSDNNNVNDNNGKNVNGMKNLCFSEKGHALGPKRCLTRHIDDTEIGKYFSTKYAVTNNATGRTEIMVERKAGSSNVIVQNFSAFDAYATFREENKKKERPDSFVHSAMGIIPKEGAEQTIRRNKSHATFSDRYRRDNIAPDNHWLCPTVESEQRKNNEKY